MRYRPPYARASRSARARASPASSIFSRDSMNRLSLPYRLSERVAAGSHVGLRENQTIGRNRSRKSEER
jgi:hypothetical protein